MGTIRFALRTNKPLKDNSCMVELVYQKNGTRRFYNTGLKAFKENWDLTGQELIYLNKAKAKKLLPGVDNSKIPTQDEVNEFNGELTKLRSHITDIEKRYSLDNEVYSPADVIKALKAIYNTTKAETVQTDLFGFIDTYLTDNAKTRVKGSLSVYRALKKHLKAYEDHTKIKITFDRINYSFFEGFQNFLIERKKTVAGESVPMLNNTTIAKQLSTVKTFLSYAKMRDIDISDSYKKFKIKKRELEVIALTSDEFETLYNYDLSNSKRLSQVRDLFCFACVTSLRYSDLAQLKREHIKNEVITLTSKKTRN
ncbi:MAG: phage integrase SAM-like domain-containing protein [Ferruginibacter sp.]